MDPIVPSSDIERLSPGLDENNDHDDQVSSLRTPSEIRIDESLSGRNRRNGRRPKGTTRSANARNKALEFMDNDWKSSRSLSSDDRSVLSGESCISMRSMDTTSSIVTALLGTNRIERLPLPQETTDIMVVSEVRLAGLVRVLMSSEREAGIPREYRTGNSLARRMKELFTFPLDKAPGWLWRPLFEGLVKGGTALDIMVTPPSAPSGAQPMPILTWLCQWRSLQKMFCWKGGNDLVSMTLAAGANPNIAMSNGSTPLFFAVKYGSLETVELLVKYGANVMIKDFKKRSCLWNALERPDPAIIAYLLQTLPATEAFPYQGKNRVKTSFQTAIDYLFAAQLSLAFDRASNPEYPWSWQVLGEPSVESVALTMIELGKRGATFTPDDITLALLGFVLRGDDSRKRRNRYPKYAEAKLRLEQLAHLAVGRWLPDSIRENLVESIPREYDNEEGSQVCSVCKGDISEPESPRIKLYCNHEFCISCLVGLSEREKPDLTCPVCQKVLCLDLVGTASERKISLADVYGGYEAPYGPNALLSKQLRMECQVRGIKTMLRNDERLRYMLLNESLQSYANRQKTSVPMFDLNTNVPVTNNVDITLEAPKGGPVAFPIIVKGIPVTAFMSTTSYFTLVSPEFVELFRLDKVGLKSDKLTNLFGDNLEAGTISLIDEFRFHIGDIEVCLRNALEAPLPSCMGVQLGMDFLQSCAWGIIDVRLDGNIEHLERNGSCITTDGYGRTLFISPNRKEELRYYTHDGRIYRTPLLHLQPFKAGGMSNWISVSLTSAFAECSWCCRYFLPAEMVQCPQRKDVYYCTESCLCVASEFREAKTCRLDSILDAEWTSADAAVAEECHPNESAQNIGDESV